jgi:predicted ATPase
VQAAIQAQDGVVFKSLGDAFYAVFSEPADAVRAALAVQQSLRNAAPRDDWPELKVRIALHTGAAEAAEGDYVGPALSRVARLLAAGHGGQTLLSEDTHALTRSSLTERASLRLLGAYRLRGLQEPEQVYQLTHPDLDEEFPALSAQGVVPNNLPQPLTTFVGREREMAELERLLGSHRLLTLTGAGGTGKTRLSIRVAAEMLDGTYPDGVWLVELASVVDAPLVPQVIAGTLGLREVRGVPLLEQLGEHLRSRHVLLVLDNCEHLVSACAELVYALLQRCPHLRVLATSREPLGVPGEQTYVVPPLSIPASSRFARDVSRLAQYEAVRLFADRAALHRPDFTLSPDNALAVVGICRQLDGIPLALELAAARVRTLSVERLAERLDDRFKLLTGGNRAGQRRQQTLQALIDWSYDLLHPREQALLRRLSVFSGGWSLAAAEAVCADDDLPDFELLDLLTALVDKSLVLSEEHHGEARFRMLESIRLYARDRLQDSGEETRWRGRHLDYFLGWSQEVMGDRGLQEGLTWLERLDRELDNLRSALDWAGQDRDSTAQGLQLASVLQRLWHARGYLTEGRLRIRTLLEADAPIPDPVRAGALREAGWLACGQGDYAAAESFAQQSLTLCRQLGEMDQVALSLDLLGAAAEQQGHFGTARSAFQEALAISERSHNERGITGSLKNLGAIALKHGDLQTAQALFLAALERWRQQRDTYEVAVTQLYLGHVARFRGQYLAARRCYEEGLGNARRIGDRTTEGWSLCDLARVATALGDFPSADRLFADGIAIWRESGSKEGMVRALEGVAQLALRRNLPEQAATLLGAAEAHRERARFALPLVDRVEYECLPALRAALGEEAFSTTWLRARGLSLEEAVDYALAAVLSD